jgi:Cft2 family RNA processing exonuclease
MEVTYRNGIYLPGPDLWLDPHTAQPFAVVTHAHSDHVRSHGRVLCSPPTAAMMRLRGARRSEFQEIPFYQSVQWNEASITLYPAGHILGSAQILIEWRGIRLLYSGDFKMKPGLSSEAIDVPQADILITETTFGLPRYRFPEREQTVNDIITFCDLALAEGSTPILFCYSLGKGQELLANLSGAAFSLYLYSEHFEMAELYRKLGVRLPPYLQFRPGGIPQSSLDGALLCASDCRRNEWFGQLDPIRTAYISGWAMDKSARWRLRTDAAFALSDHADYDELHGYVRAVGAKTVYTTHGYDHAFASDLRNLGIAARPLRLPASKPAMEIKRRSSKHCRLTLPLPF